jgi:hypothetical protein
VLSLISHIRNEALLLPHWIAHHRPMFDAATIIDYASTDDSLDIIRTLAPEWRIVRSQNVDFDANDADFEVMQIEFYTPGWKIALNTTEFLIAPHLRAVLQSAEASDFHGITGESFFLTDKARLGMAGLVPGVPLMHQLHHGRQEEAAKAAKRRLLHRWRTGAYAVGRHSWMRGPTAYTPDLLYATLLYAPWDESMIQRKMAIGAQVSAHDRKKGLGFHHLRDAAQLQRDFEAEAVNCVDLRDNELWARLTGITPLKQAA